MGPVAELSVTAESLNAAWTILDEASLTLVRAKSIVLLLGNAHDEPERHSYCAEIAAELLGTLEENLPEAQTRIYELASSGQLPSYKFGGAVRFDLADVEAYKAACRSAGTPEMSAGALRSTESLRASGSGLAALFRKAGVKPRPMPTTARKAAGSTPLTLASRSKHR